MSVLKGYETKVLHLLASGVLSAPQLESLEGDGEFVGYEYTGSGYFLSIRHTSLPRERIVCHKPVVTGSADGIDCGFVIFIEDGRLTIECHSWGDTDVPEGFRERDVQVAVLDALCAQRVMPAVRFSGTCGPSLSDNSFQDETP